jgi:hypothetical protein
MLFLVETLNSEIHYSIVAGNEEGYLSVDSLSGRVKVLRPFDFESLPISNKKEPLSNVRKLNFTLKAEDTGVPPRFSLSFLTLFVFDVNDHNPLFSKNFLQRSVREDLPGGSSIAKLEATDGDGSAPFNRVFYRIERGSQDKFLIESESGTVRLSPGAQLDSNSRPFHILEIIALDGGGRQSESSCILNVTLQDINNKKPQFEFSNETGGDSSSSSPAVGGFYYAKVGENSPKGHYITQVRGSDPDSAAVLRYSINYNKSEARNENGRILKGLDLAKLIEIDPIDGIVRVGSGALLDREVVETIRLELSVQDIASETGEQKATAGMILTVMDENDNDPVFRMNPYLASIPENTQDGITVLTVQADDADKDRIIKYSIQQQRQTQQQQQQGSQNSRDGRMDKVRFPFVIDPETGVITLASKVDRETRDWVNFTVVAEDAGTNPRRRQAAVPVRIRILDKNDNVVSWKEVSL